MFMKLIDTHAHLDDESMGNTENLVKQADESGVKYIIAPGVDLDSSLKVRDLADRFPGVYFAAGLHAHDASKFIERDLLQIKKMLTHKKAVAVGEIGLDYHYDFSPRSIQRHVLKRYLDLAVKIGKPVILHCREAEEDLFSILKEYDDKIRGVIHCYTGGVEWAEKFVKIGFYIGFTGVITFKKSESIREVVKTVPSHRLLTETDAPYMTPVPYRGKINQPANVRIVAEKIAEVKGMTLEQMERTFLENASACFGVDFA